MAKQEDIKQEIANGMHGHHDHHMALSELKNQHKIVLAGNPNVGKSVFFNSLTGMYVDVSNYPGTTLDISHGKYGDSSVIDTPGVYGISSFNDEEKIARDVILSADTVINVVDAVHLERDLFLSQQIIDTGVPVLMVLNMMDDAQKQGIKIDTPKLSQLLGVPIVEAIAVKGIGVGEVKQSINKATVGNPTSDELKKMLAEMKTKVTDQGEGLLVLEGDPIIAARHGLPEGDKREYIYTQRRKCVSEILEQAVQLEEDQQDFRTKLGRWMLRPITGIPILAVALYFMYQFIGVFIAQTVVGITEEEIMGGMYTPFMENLVGSMVSLEHPLGYILAGEFGILTMTVTYVLGLLLPLVLGFYFLLSFLEDSGYLPRLAALTDRMLMAIGLNGRAIIPFILGFGCITLASVVTRLLGNERERRICIFLLALAIPCSAQLGVITGMLANIGGLYVALFVVVIFCVLAIVGTLINRMLPGEGTDLLIDLPPLRFPKVTNVFKKTFNKSFGFLKEAAPLFALGALIISVMQLTGLLTWVQKVLAPVMTGWLNLPPEAATAFVMGIVRRDFGAAGLSSLNLDPMSTIVSLIVITLFVPCIATILVLFKERNKKEAGIIWFGSMFIAILVGGLVSQIASLFPTDTVALVGTMAVFIVATIVIGLICKKTAKAKETKRQRVEA